MRSKSFCVALLLVFMASVPLIARARAVTWTEVRSPHFIVVTDASEKAGRRVADEFERIRGVFRRAFPQMRVDPSSPIIVLAARDDKTFRTLAPSSWLEKNQLQRTGMFLAAPDQKWILLRLNAPGDNPYHLIVHEYTHMVMNLNVQSLPLWLDEGLAEFYGNSVIRDKDVALGEASPGDIQLLREQPLLPLRVLFAVNHSSPYYNEQNKGTIFYAESWALTHYLLFRDLRNKTTRLADFLTLAAQGLDPATAAARTIGDVGQLETELRAYVRQSAFNYEMMKGSTEIDSDAFTARELPDAESAALRGDFQVDNQRFVDAKSLLEDALHDDPQNVRAREGLGLMALIQGRHDEAKKWYAAAVKLDSRSYLAQYYYAALTLQQSLAPDDAAQVESSLRKAIEINPTFAPAYDLLANFYGMRDEHLDDAHMLALRAVSLEPGNINYFLTTGNLLLRMKRPDDAVRVANRARSMAKSLQDEAKVQALLASAHAFQEYLAAQEQAVEQARAAESAQSLTATSVETMEITQQESLTPPVLQHREDVSERGPRSSADGKIASVACAGASMDVILATSAGVLTLHSPNYFNLPFTAANFKPEGELHPCTDLRGRKAHVAFWKTKGQHDHGELISVELWK